MQKTLFKLFSKIKSKITSKFAKKKIRQHKDKKRKNIFSRLALLLFLLFIKKSRDKNIDLKKPQKKENKIKKNNRLDDGIKKN